MTATIATMGPNLAPPEFLPPPEPPPKMPFNLSCSFLNASSRSGGPSLFLPLSRPPQGSLSFPGSFQAIVFLHVESKAVLGMINEFTTPRINHRAQVALDHPKSNPQSPMIL